MAAVDHHLQSELQSLSIDALSHRLKGFLISKHTFNNEQCLILTHEKLYDHPPLGPTSRVRIIIKGNEYVVHVLLREIQRGMLPAIDAETRVLEICSKFSLDSPIYRFCSGIHAKEYEEMHEIICFDVKSVRQTFNPFLHVESV